MPVKTVVSDSLQQAMLFEVPVRGAYISHPKDISLPFYPVYEVNQNILFEGNSIEWLQGIESETVDLIFADPPYNIKKADWDKFESQEQYIEWSMSWIQEAARILRKNGTLYICGFSEILADLKHPSMKYFTGCK